MLFRQITFRQKFKNLKLVRNVFWPENDASWHFWNPTESNVIVSADPMGLSIRRVKMDVVQEEKIAGLSVPLEAKLFRAFFTGYWRPREIVWSFTKKLEMLSA